MPTLTTRPASHVPTQHAPPGSPKHVRALTAGWGVYMLAMAGVNAWLAVTGRADVHAEFADGAYLQLDRDAWQTLVEPHPLPWVLALTGLEAAVGVATLTRGRARLIWETTTSAVQVATGAGPVSPIPIVATVLGTAAAIVAACWTFEHEQF